MAPSNAQRQRRYRERRRDGAPPIRYRRPRDRRSRPQRWRDAVETLMALQAEYQDWLDALPEGDFELPVAMVHDWLASRRGAKSHAGRRTGGE